MDRLTRLLRAQYDTPALAEPGPTVCTASGLRATQFDDGAVAIVLDEQEGPKQAMHLSAAQADELARYFRTLRNADGPRSILDEAREIVAGDREQTHGAPDHNLRAIGAIWTALLRGHLKSDAQVTPQLVCLLMAGLKLARAANRPSHREHVLDTVGYMALMERCGYVDPPGNE